MWEELGTGTKETSIRHMKPLGPCESVKQTLQALSSPSTVHGGRLRGPGRAPDLAGV